MPRGRPASIKMDGIELTNSFAEDVLHLMVDAVGEEKKEAVPHLAVGVLVDLAHSISAEMSPHTALAIPGLCTSWP